MDIQHFSPSYSLDDALEQVGHNLVYDPLTKQLCLRTQKAKDGSSNKEYPSCTDKCEQKADQLSCDSRVALDANEQLNQFVCSNADSTTQRFDNIQVSDQTNSSKIILLQQMFGKFSLVDKFRNSNKMDEQKYEKILAKDLSDNISIFQRPSNLPPKTKDEERKHLAEFNEIVKQVKRKKLKELKQRKQSLAKQVRQEEEMSEAIRVWTCEILPSWSSSHTTKRARDLWWSGIPSPIRPKVWTIAIGNQLRITKELFDICLQHSKEIIWHNPTSQDRRSSSPTPVLNGITKTHRRSMSQTTNSKYANAGKLACKDDEDGVDDNSESTAFLIKLDVSRTFPQLGFFQETGPYHDALTDILAAYAVYRPDLGYCQGMSFLAAMLFLNLDSQLDTFTAFANLLHNELLLAFYKLDEVQMRAVYQYYERQLEALFPKLARHFASVGLSTDLFLVYQIYTLFSRSLPLECACRVWDLFFRDGDEFIFRASLAILAIYQDDLLHLEFIDLAKFLSTLPDDLDTERYFSLIHSIKLVPPKLSECLQERHLMPYSKSFSTHANSSLVTKIFNFF